MIFVMLLLLLFGEGMIYDGKFVGKKIVAVLTDRNSITMVLLHIPSGSVYVQFLKI